MHNLVIESMFLSTVLTAKHPFEALSTLRLMEGGIDLVVSDYHMPDMNGVQLQKKILEEFKIPVISEYLNNSPESNRIQTYIDIYFS